MQYQHERDLGLPGYGAPSLPYENISPEAAVVMQKLAQDQKLAKFVDFWRIMGSPDEYTRLTATARRYIK